MSNKANSNHKSNIKNANRGTSGNNTANAKANGNRGKQLNPNRK
ncbi:alpha-amylase [Amphritea sp.]